MTLPILSRVGQMGERPGKDASQARPGSARRLTHVAAKPTI